jgi:hypothetical protein
VDCAASDIFIDPSFASQFTSALIKKLLVPRYLTLFDGTPSTSGPITDALYMEVVFGKNFRQHLEFFIMKLHPSAKVMLSLCWLQKTNPLIDWRSMIMTFPNNPSELPLLAPTPLVILVMRN